MPMVNLSILKNPVTNSGLSLDLHLDPFGAARSVPACVQLKLRTVTICLGTDSPLLITI